MDEEKLKSLMADEAFVNKLLELETPEEVCAAFEKEGITVTADEISKLKEKLESAGTEGELSEDALEEVAGGFLLLWSAAVWGASALTGIGIGEKITRRRW